MKEPHNTWSNTNELQQYQVHHSHTSDTITTPSNLPPVLMASNPLVNNEDKQSGISTASWFPNFLYFFKEALAMQHSIQLYCKCPKQGCSKPKNRCRSTYMSNICTIFFPPAQTEQSNDVEHACSPHTALIISEADHKCDMNNYLFPIC